MKIVIAGAGEVGSYLAKTLSGNGHDITVIDPELRLLNELATQADIIPVEGDLTTFATLRKASVRKCDLFIAVNNVENDNVLSAIMAKQLGVPVICLSQLNRAAEARQDKRPLLSDLRESGSIEQDADVVIGLYREGYNNRECENPNLAEAIVLKNRKGQTGTVNLTWVPEYTSFYSVEKYRGDEA